MSCGGRAGTASLLRTYVWGIWLAPVVALGEFFERVGIGVDGLLKQSVEEHSSAAAVPPVESECVLVEVVVEVFR